MAHSGTRTRVNGLIAQPFTILNKDTGFTRILASASLSLSARTATDLAGIFASASRPLATAAASISTTFAHAIQGGNARGVNKNQFSQYFELLKLNLLPQVRATVEDLPEIKYQNRF